VTPATEFQLAFLRQLQRLFNEGEFVATYKFALLHAIADLCVERADDPNGQLHLPLRDLGEKFVELYWQHAAPYRDGLVIRQNTGEQAAIVNELRALRETHKTLATFRSSADWQRSVSSAASLLKRMPLWKLQTLAGRQDEFLYPNRPVENGILLRPGVAHCLRMFYPLVLQLVRTQWMSHIRRIPGNYKVVDEYDLEDFLFGSHRKALQPALEVLLEIQHGNCLYCGEPLDGSAHVDHFIPWSRYPRDLAHNLVLAHDKCNLAKRDTLAARVHVERWLARNEAQGALISKELGSAFLCDAGTSLRVARWSYEIDAQADANLWLRGKDYVPFEPAILGML
jgi:hypothetical protein